MNAQNQICLAVSSVTALSSILNAAVLTERKEDILKSYNQLLQQLAVVGQELAIRYGFQAERREA